MNTLILLVAAGVGNPPAAPLFCAEPSAAKGEVKGGPPLVHTFELVHRGAAGTLTITKVETGCGCLRQGIQKTVLQPGETTSLAIEVNTLTQPDGPNRWQATVGYKLEPPGMPAKAGEILLQITATLSREVIIQPPQLGFSTAGEASQVLTITDTRGKPLNIIRAVSSSPHLKADISQRQSEPMKPSRQAVTVKLAADAPAGQRDEVVVLQTDDPAYPEFRVPVRVLKRAAGGVIATPDSIAIRFAAGQTEVSTLVRLRSATGKSISITHAESDHPGVLVKWSASAGPVATVRVTVTERAAAQGGTCQVRVRLSEPNAGEISIPVAWSALKK